MENPTSRELAWRRATLSAAELSWIVIANSHALLETTRVQVSVPTRWDHSRPSTPGGVYSHGG